MEKLTTYDRVLIELRGAILSGSHAPGTRLRQTELAQLYSTSRIPLREALRTLEAEGLVTSEPNCGATVAGLDAADVSELYAFRVALERATARAAAARKADLRPAVEGWRREVAAAIAAGEIEPVIAADKAFHDAIAIAAHNRHIHAALESRWAHVVRAMRIYLHADRYSKYVWDEHAAVAEAIAAGDEDTADDLLRTHVERSGAFVLSQLHGGDAASG
jgi:DNA-binding GntR family transcriptional regulator